MSGRPSGKGAEVLAFVEAFIHGQGYSPSLRDIGAGVGLSSSNTVKYHVDRLIKAGELVTTPGQPRSLRLPRREQ